MGEKKFDKLKKNLKLKSQGIESDTKLKLEKNLKSQRMYLLS